MKKISLSVLVGVWVLACQKDLPDYDASGHFEANEVIVSAQQTGQILAFSVQEGANLKQGDAVGRIDVAGAELQKEQVQASIRAMQQRTTNVQPQLELTRRQLAVQQAQLAQAIRERDRTQRLVEAQSATPKQLDDLNAQVTQLQRQIAVTQQQIRVTQSNNTNQNRSVLSEKSSLQKAAAQYDLQIRKGTIINPVAGTVLTQYAYAGEMATVGKPLYRIANLDTLLLRAYITGTQLPHVKLNQAVRVRIDDGQKNYKDYPGTIVWISDKSEFTPKTIQTQDERANLVYALKIRVKNDGFLKIGMYGEVKLNDSVRERKSE